MLYSERKFIIFNQRLLNLVYLDGYKHMMCVETNNMAKYKVTENIKQFKQFITSVSHFNSVKLCSWVMLKVRAIMVKAHIKSVFEQYHIPQHYAVHLCFLIDPVNNLGMESQKMLFFLDFSRVGHWCCEIWREWRIGEFISLVLTCPGRAYCIMSCCNFFNMKRKNSPVKTF
jgi:hypothetical protein